MRLFPSQNGVFKTSRGERRRGAAVVEFAVVVPLLFLIFFGIIEFGRMVMVQQILTNAAREGARKAVLPGSTDTQVQTVIDSYLTGAGIREYTRTISPSATTASSGTSITVTVTTCCDCNSWLPVNKWFKNANLTSSVVMRKEGN